MEKLVYQGEVFIDRGRDEYYLDSLGFYGAEWRIRHADGRETDTNNLWSDVFGDVPRVDGEADNCVILQPVKRTSPASGIERTLWLPMITPTQSLLLDRGGHVQEVLTQYTAAEREFWMTGITDEEWNELFAEGEDDE